MARRRRRRAELSIKVDGVKVTIRELTRWSKKLSVAVEAQTKKDARKALERAKAGKFKDRSGTLRNRIQMKYFSDSKSALISVPRLKYAPIVNYGYQRRFEFLPTKKIKRQYNANIRRVVRKQVT